MDPHGRIVYANEAACRSLGQSREELLSLTIPDIDPLYSKETWESFWGEVKVRGSMTFESEHHTKQGRVFPVEVTANYLEFDGKEYSFAFARDITERKRAEETIPQDEEKYRSLLANIPAIVWTADAQGVPIFISTNRESMTGYSHEELCNSLLWQEIVHPEDVQKVVAAYAAFVAGGAHFDVESRFRRKDGQWMWLHSRAITTYVKDGRRLVDGIHSDITERKQAEEAIRESEEKYRSLVSNIPDVAWTVDAHQHITFISPNIERMTGYTMDEVYAQGGRLYLDSVHPDDFQKVREGIEALFASDQPFDIECRLRHKNGKWIWAHDRALKTYEKDGIRCADGLLSDISERKRAEMENSRLALVVNSSDDAILSLTREGLIDTWNAGAERMYGYTTEEIKEKHVSILIPWDRRPVLAAHEEILLRGEAVVHYDGENQRKDGTKLQVSLTLSPIKDAAGVVTGVSVTTRDITERKQAEEETRRAKEAAEAANRAKSQFLANMSHEIRTPMNGVIGMAGLLLDTELTPEQRQYAEIIRDCGEALLAVIIDILDFSKIEARKLTLETNDFDLHTVLESAAAVLAIKAFEKGLELICEMESGTPRLLRGDPGRVRQVLVNLLGNAVKFTPQGEVAIRVGIEAEEERMATLRFTVSDTGIGFRQDRAAALFEPFVQEDGSSTRRYGGTGLGLAISKQLVEMMGGRIGVESGKAEGSTFWFTAVFEKQPPPSAHVTDLPPSLRGAKVLVVEDNATNRSLVCRLLSSWGCRPEGSADGNSALAILRLAAQGVDPFQIALLDMSLPGMDGEELGRRIVADPQLKDTALVLMTGCGRRSDWACLQARGLAGHVSKPIWEHSLREALLPLGAKGDGTVFPAKQVVQSPSVVRGSGQARMLVAEDNALNLETRGGTSGEAKR
jgi:PAS domain S-box-containing protein